MDHHESEDIKKLIEAMSQTNAQFSKILRTNFNYTNARPGSSAYTSSNPFTGKSGVSQFLAEQEKYGNQTSRSLKMFHGSVSGVHKSLKLLDGSFKDATNALKSAATTILGGTIGGLVVGSAVDFSHHLIDNGRIIADAGQSLSGGFLGLMETAREGQMTLSEFAEVAKKNSKVLGIFGSAQFAQISKNVKSVSAGLYDLGYSTEQIDQITTSTLDRFRLSGQRFAQDQYAKSIIETAKQTNLLSKAFSTSREEILKISSDLQKDGSYSAVVSTMDTKSRERHAGAINSFAGIGGDAGNFMASMYAHSVTMGGSTIQTDEGKALNDAGLGDIVQKMDELVKDMPNMNPEQQARAVAKLAEQYTHDMTPEVIKSMAIRAGTGDASAKKALELLGQMRDITEASVDKALKDKTEADQSTKQLLEMEAKWNAFASKAQVFLLKNILIPVSENANLEQIFSVLKGGLTDMWASLKPMIDNGSLKNLLKDSFTLFTSIVKGGLAISSFLGSLGPVGQSVVGLGAGILAFKLAFGGITKLFLALPKKMLSFFSLSKLAETVNIKAAIVNVHGASFKGGIVEDIIKNKKTGKAIAGGIAGALGGGSILGSILGNGKEASALTDTVEDAAGVVKDTAKHTSKFGWLGNLFKGAEGGVESVAKGGIFSKLAGGLKIGSKIGLKGVPFLGEILTALDAGSGFYHGFDGDKAKEQFGTSSFLGKTMAGVNGAISNVAAGLVSENTLASVENSVKHGITSLFSSTPSEPQKVNPPATPDAKDKPEDTSDNPAKKPNDDDANEDTVDLLKDIKKLLKEQTEAITQMLSAQSDLLKKTNKTLEAR